MMRLVIKLKKVAKSIAEEKPKLHFLGLVPHPLLPWLYALLVSSDQLDRSGRVGLDYVVGQLRKHLTAKDMARISRIVILPHTKDLIRRFDVDEDFSPVALRGLYRSDPPEEVIIIWPLKHATAVVQTA
jgi:hypothetical protein